MLLCRLGDKGEQLWSLGKVILCRSILMVVGAGVGIKELLAHGLGEYLRAV